MGKLTEDQEREVERIAELKTREYFDHYLAQVFPKQAATIIESHNNNRDAHGGVEHRVNRLVWIGMGLSATGGGVVGALLRNVQLF